MRLNVLVFVAITVVVAQSCSPKPTTAVVFSEMSDHADLKEYKTYAWLPIETDFEELAIISIEDQLQGRGYRRDVDDPDFLVAVHIINEPTDELVRTPLYSNLDYRGPGYYSGPFQNYYFNDQITVPIISAYTTEELNFIQGTLVVDIIDRDKMEIIWRGWAQDQRNHPLDVLQDVPGYIDQIFSRFPVDPK